MSVTQTAQLACPHCDHRQNFVYWRSINIEQDPTVKDDLLQRKLHVLECDRCGTETPIHYRTLYHSPEDAVMLWLCPEGNLPLQDKEDVMSSLPSALLKRYRFRTVSNLNDLLEKIRCVDDGLDDRAVEIVKLLTLQQLLKQTPELPDSTALYYSDTTRESKGFAMHFVLVRPGIRQSKTLTLPRSIYDGVITDFQGQLLEDNHWPTVDRKYAAQLFASYHLTKKS